MYPDVLVLDAYGWTPRFLALAQQCAVQHPCCRSEFFVPDLIAHVVEQLRERRRSEHQLRQLAGLIQAGQCHSHGDFVPPVFAPLVMEFGLHLLHQLDTAKVWDVNGQLPYHVQQLRTMDRPDHSGVYLRFTRELPA